MRNEESHFVHRVGWLRAMVLGANDGIISTAALLLGVAAADADRTALLTAGVSAMVAGAVSMGLGEYVSVASQRDSERSDIAKERWELANEADHELEELTGIYISRGLSPDLAARVAEELTAHDPLGAHLERMARYARLIAKSVAGTYGLNDEFIEHVKKNPGKVYYSSPGIGGTVTMNFQVGPSGGLDFSKVGKSTLGHAGVENCISQRMMGWKFPKPLGGVAVKVSYPFLLRPVGG